MKYFDALIKYLVVICVTGVGLLLNLYRSYEILNKFTPIFITGERVRGFSSLTYNRDSIKINLINLNLFKPVISGNSFDYRECIHTFLKLSKFFYFHNYRWSPSSLAGQLLGKRFRCKGIIFNSQYN